MLSCQQVWHRLFGRVIARGTSHTDGDGRVASRAKFWAEFREGRQEAEGRADRDRLGS